MKRIEPAPQEETCVVELRFEPAPKFVTVHPRQRRYPKHMRQSKSHQGFAERLVNNRERGTVSQVFVEPRGVRQRAKDPDRPQSQISHVFNMNQTSYTHKSTKTSPAFD
jgi:hypothetical protein